MAFDLFLPQSSMANCQARGNLVNQAIAMAHHNSMTTTDYLPEWVGFSKSICLLDSMLCLPITNEPEVNSIL